MNQASRAEQVRGLWQYREGGAHFYATRLSEDGKYAYGYGCDASGRLNPRAPLVKMELTAGGTVAGYRRPRKVSR